MQAAEPFVYDELLGWIDELAVTDAVESATSAERLHIVGALAGAHGTKPRREVAIALLDSALDRAEGRLRTLVGQWSVDLGQAVLRRFPLTIYHPNWLPTVTLAIEKFAASTSTDEVQRTVSGTALASWLDEQTLLDCFRVAAAAQMMCEIVSIRRAVSKGARFRPTAANPYQLDWPGSLREAISSYDARRSADFRVFQQQGLLAGDMRYERGPHGFLLGRLSSYTLFYVPERDFRLSPSYLLLPFPIADVWEVLEPYRRAIEDSYRLRLEDIAHVLASLAVLIGMSIRYLTEADGRLVLEPADEPERNEEKLKFTFDLLRKGNMRLHRSDWSSQIGRVRSPWAADEGRSIASAERFFNAFSVAPGAELDLRGLRPMPFVLQGATDSLYVDLAGTADWLESIVEEAQGVLESQHGDIFQLAVTQLLRAQVSGQTIASRWEFTDANGHSRRGDILVVTPASVYCVECKAFRKGPTYMRGDVAPLQRRSEAVRDALEQASEAAVAVQAGRTRAVAVEGRRVEAVVCTASPEFLNPVSKFGMLADGIPRVCSARELATLLTLDRS